MGGCGDDVGEFEGRRHDSSSHEAGNVSHVGHQVSAALVGDLPEPGIVQVPGIAGDA